MVEQKIDWSKHDLSTFTDKGERFQSKYRAVLAFTDKGNRTRTFMVIVTINKSNPLGKISIDIPLQSSEKETREMAIFNSHQVNKSDTEGVIRNILDLPVNNSHTPITAIPYAGTTDRGLRWGITISTKLTPGENDIANTNAKKLEVAANLLQEIKGFSLTPAV